MFVLRVMGNTDQSEIRAIDAISAMRSGQFILLKIASKLCLGHPIRSPSKIDVMRIQALPVVPSSLDRSRTNHRFCNKFFRITLPYLITR